MDHGLARSLSESQRILNDAIRALRMECYSGGNIKIQDCTEGDAKWEQCCHRMNDMSHNDHKTIHIHRIQTIFNRHLQNK